MNDNDEYRVSFVERAIVICRRCGVMVELRRGEVVRWQRAHSNKHAHEEVSAEANSS